MPNDTGCICEGNWREIVAEYEPLFDRIYEDETGAKCRFVGIVHASDDYYYLLMDEHGKCILATCVGSLETNGFTLKDWPCDILLEEAKLLRDIFGEE